jgi:excisionase family DNA binding protein
VTGRLSPEQRVVRALDELRDAMAEVLAARVEPAAPSGLMTLTATARRLGVARSTVGRWADSGRLPTTGPAHARRVRSADLERLTGRS